MRHALLNLLLVCLSSQMFDAWGGTFVGNGGSEGDVELAVTLMQIRDSFEVIQQLKPDDEDLCRCNPAYENSALCEPLKSLATEQVAHCRAVLLQQAAQVLSLVQRRENLRVRWTNTPIEVREGDQLRAADAVTDPTTREITVNVTQFRQMRQGQRVFLMTHELLHLTEFDGRSMEDLGQAGPFAGADGGRNRLNAMAAATSVLQGVYPDDINTYQRERKRSQAWKPYWIEFNMGTASYEKSGNSTYELDRYSQRGLIGRRQWTRWGVWLGWRQLATSEKLLESIQLEETINIFSAGASYRFFMSRDPLTFWGQSFVLVQAGLEHVQSKFSVTEHVEGADTTIGETARAQAVGASSGVAFYAPLMWGLWGQLGVGYEFHPYKLKQFNIDYDRGVISITGGISYGF